MFIKIKKYITSDSNTNLQLVLICNTLKFQDRKIMAELVRNNSVLDRSVPSNSINAGLQAFLESLVVNQFFVHFSAD
ncbi:MAG: hypothetical protein NTV30_06720 [Chloroflexi bacterium]|nr:hypothetical protein [Chloroflexota bacterium]